MKGDVAYNNGVRYKNRIREFRGGRSRNWLSKEADVSCAYVEKLENGQSAPTIGVAWRIARALGAKVSELWPFLIQPQQKQEDRDGNHA